MLENDSFCMRKQEFLHLHILLSEVFEYLENEYSTDFDTGRYESLEVRPNSVYMGKEEHKEGVFALAHDIASGLESAEEAPEMYELSAKDGYS